MPDVADRDADAKLAAGGLGAGGLEHPSAQNAEFELADLALHAEQQTIVGVARIVDAILVDDACLDETAELEKMVPVPAVARDPRSLETKHGSNVPGAQPGDEALETGPRNGTVRRQALIVVDDFDPGKAVPARHIDEIVLAALALQIVPHLLGRGLTDIDHGLARQHRSRQRFSDAHRHPPSPGRSPLPEATRPLRSPPRLVPPSSDRAASVRRAACRAVGVLSAVALLQAKTSSRSSPLTVPSSGELCRKPWPTRSS